VSSGGRRILVVDDDPASCELVAYALKSIGYNVAIAADGSRALNMDLDDDIELVILDVHMPEHDGAEVLMMLRERHTTRSIRVLAITGDVSQEARNRMDNSGADGFLTKPVDLAELRREVGRLMPGLAQHEGGLYRRVRERGVGYKLGLHVIDPRAELLRDEG
jgi:hypothetical protein